jgi:hypothetical protein
MKTKSGLYLPSQSRGMLTRAEDVWVLSWADKCRLPWEKGQHLLIADGFELEPGDMDLWDTYKDDSAFADLRKFVEEVEGRVRTTIVHEESILAEVTGDLYQEEAMW